MPRKPILIFVPGAGHTIETWDKVSTLLAAQKFECIPITLPSATGDVTAGLGDDVQAVRNAITAETTQGHDVVLVVHSYGGAVGQSAIKNLTIPKLGCEKEEGKGYVIGMVMLASGFGITGMSFIDGLGGTPPPTWRVDPSGFAEFTLIIPTRELFYHDLPVEEGDYWVSKLKKQSLKSLMEGGEFSYSGWKDVPVWFLATSEDKAFPVEAQRSLVKFAQENGGDVTVKEITSGHSVMLAKPAETAEFILEAVASFTK